MYDLSTPEGRRWYEEDSIEFERLKTQQKPKEVKREHKHDNIKLTLWTGCSPEYIKALTISNNNDSIILDSSLSRSKAIWFAHNLQMNGKENAINHTDGVFITHQIPAIAHYNIVTYDNGSTSEELDEEWASKANRMTEAPVAIFGAKSIELPNGWTFSEHLDKHILCIGKITLKHNQLMSI